jgi:hypothetical protein
LNCIRYPDSREEVKDDNTTEHLINIKKIEESMSFKDGGRTYYRTKSEALEVRRKGDRIYYDADVRAYYIIRPTKRNFWEF